MKALLKPESSLLGHSSYAKDDPISLNEEILFILSQHFYGEQFAAALIKKIIEHPNFSKRSLEYKAKLIELFEEESSHASLIEEFLLRKFGRIRPISPYLKPMLSTGMKMIDLQSALLGVHLAIEPLGIGSLGHLLNSVNDGDLVELIKKLLQDESKHVLISEDIVREFPQLDLSSAEPWIQLCIVAMRHQSCPLEIYEEIYGEAKARDIYEIAMNGPVAKAVASRGFRIMLKQLRRSGFNSFIENRMPLVTSMNFKDAVESAEVLKLEAAV